MNNLQQARIAAGMTQKDLAEASGVNLRMIQHYEQGVKDIRVAQAVTVLRLADALHVSAWDLIKQKEGEA